MRFDLADLDGVFEFVLNIMFFGLVGVVGVCNLWSFFFFFIFVILNSEKFIHKQTVFENVTIKLHDYVFLDVFRKALVCLDFV